MLYIFCPQGWKLRRPDPPSSSNRGMPGGTSGPDAQSRSAAIPPSYKVTRNAIFLNCEAFGYKSILENTFICISYSYDVKKPIGDFPVVSKAMHKSVVQKLEYLPSTLMSTVLLF